MGKRSMLKGLVKRKAKKSFENRLAKHVRLASWISWLGMPAGIGGRIAVFVAVMLFPVFMWLVSAAAVLLLLSGGLIAVHKLDPSIAVEKPKESEKESSGGGTGGKSVTVPDHLKGKFFVPAGTFLSSPQGSRILRGQLNYHDGIDFSNNRQKSSIYPIYPGVVELAKPGGAFGNVMVVKHDVDGELYYSLYAHLDSFTSKVGDHVGYNTELGIMGTTGNSTGIHLHLELFDKNYKWYDRTKTLQVAKYLTCTEGSMLTNQAQDIRKCIEYRNKMVK